MCEELYNVRFYHTYRDEAAMQIAKRFSASIKPESLNP